MTITDPGSTSSSIDHNDPYYLHPSDHPGIALVPEVFDGRNFNDWRASVRTSLSAKHKLSFLTGSLACPSATDPKYVNWIRCNDMVKSWLMNSLAPPIRRSVLHTANSSVIWTKLNLRYGKPSITQLFSVQKELNHYVQGASSVSEYFTGLTTLWDEIAGLKIPTVCSCGLTCALETESDRVLQFLMGLNESYTAIRGSILLMKPLPDVDQTYSLILQEETQRELNAGTPIVHESSSMFVQNKFDSSKSEKKPLFCTNCKKTNHTVDRCFFLIGFPPSYKGNKKPSKPNSQGKFAGSAVTPSPTAQLTTDQISRLLSFLDSGAVDKGHPSSQDDFAGFAANAVQELTSNGFEYATSPNPNGFEFDNLYLDMNRIINPCRHPDDLNELHPTTFEEVFNSVFEYVDRLFNIVRPRNLIYFAIDGVPPRAKLNVQRAGRYQNAKKRHILEREEERLRSEYNKAGMKLLPKATSDVEDPNIITPGTEFMCEFSKALHAYIQTRLKENPAWKNLKVILSDANVPGEGEYKMLCFIRSQRSLPDYNVNTRHCIHGLDADLIMLALATHELHFSILREDVFKQEQPLRTPTGMQNIPLRKCFSYQFLHIWILKEYLELDFKPTHVPEGFQFDTERAIDDFVFIFFFVGNDFLPRLPSLAIREGSLDLLMTVYKRDFKSLGGYLVDVEQVNEPNGAYLNLERVEKFVYSLASYEDTILVKRTMLSEYYIGRALRELSLSRDDDATGTVIPIDIQNGENDDIIKNTHKLNEELGSILWDNDDVFKTGLFADDKIKCGTIGWKERYYQENFGFKDHFDLESIKEVAVKYTEGLCWVLLYYFSSGVPSWSWYYPYHYGPCASDLRGIGQLRVQFEQGFPFEPSDQLMAVLPPTSDEILPKSYRKLMTDESSDIVHLFPREFEVDMAGQRHSWRGLCLLPFIDEELLLRATRKAKEELTEYESQRNSVKTDLLFVRANGDFGSKLLSKIEDDPSGIEGVGGFANLVAQPIDSSNGEDRILCVHFDMPKLEIQARAPILNNVDHPPRTVDESDIKKTSLWHEQYDSRINRVPNHTRHSRPQENTQTRYTSAHWRGRGVSTLPTSNREGLYNHPNRSKHVVNSYETSSRVDNRGSPVPGSSRPHDYENIAWRSPRWTSENLSKGRHAGASEGGKGQYYPSRDSGSSGRW